MNEEIKKMVRCPFCGSSYKLLVEGRTEGYFQCLQCDRRFVLPSTIEEAKGEPNILSRVMP